MFSQTGRTEKNKEADQAKAMLNSPELYLKNLAEYQKMLELLSLNEQLTALLGNEETSGN